MGSCGLQAASGCVSVLIQWVKCSCAFPSWKKAPWRYCWFLRALSRFYMENPVENKSYKLPLCYKLNSPYDTSWSTSVTAQSSPCGSCSLSGRASSFTASAVANTRGITECLLLVQSFPPSLMTQGDCLLS